MKISKYLDYPYLFLFIGLIFGFQFVFTNPPWQTNDEDRHFFNAYALTRGIIGPQLKDSTIGQYLPKKLIESVNSFQSISFSDTVKIRKSVFEDFKAIDTEQDSLVFWRNPTSTITPFAYIPSALGIMVGKALYKSPIEIGWYGRAGSLLAYLLIVFFAIRILPYGKPLLAVSALTPMALYQAASVSYDGMSFALLFLYFALVIKCSYTEKGLGLKYVLSLITVALLQRFCKDGYSILFFVALVLPWTSFGHGNSDSRRNYVILVVGLIAASLLPSFLWNSYLRSLHLPDTALNILQKDFVFNTSMNLKYHLSQPLHFVILGLKNIAIQGKEWLIGATGRFGYSYTKLPDMVSLACWVVIACSCVFQQPQLSTRMALTFFAVGFLNVAAIVYGFLIVGSPVGANFIFGLQGRYFTPIIPFLFAGAFQVKIVDVAPGTLKLGLLVAISAILLYTVHFLDKTFYFSQ
jgi:uncharacterized membrane protein